MKRSLKKKYKSKANVGFWHSFFNRPMLIMLACLAALLILVFGGYKLIFAEDNSIKAGDAFIVIIKHDNEVQTIPSHSQTVGQLLNKMHIKLYKGDVVEPEKDTVIAQDDFRINIYRAVPVKVVDGKNAEHTFSAASTPRGIVQQVGYKVHPADGVESEPVTNFVKQRAIGEIVRVEPSFPVRLNLYGSKLTVRTHAETVGQLLRSKGLIIASGDQVLPSLDTQLKAGMGIVVARKGTKLKSIVEPIAMPVKTIRDSDLAYGTRAIRQHGSPGKKAVIYSVNKKTGHKKIIQTVVLQDPVKQIVAVGTNLSGTRGDVIRAGISAEDYYYVDYIVSNESGWCPTKWQGEYGSCTGYHGTPSSSSVGYGLCQATPGWKMASAGSDWATNPITQLKWCNSYAVERYGSWENAYYHKINDGWW